MVVADVVLMVVDHVDDRIANLARRSQRTLMVAVANDVASRPEPVVDVAAHPDGEAAEASGQGAAIAGLDDEVQVIGLHAEVEDAERRPAGELTLAVLTNGLADDAGDGGSAERAQLVAKAPGDVNGKLAVVERPASVR